MPEKSLPVLSVVLSFRNEEAVLPELVKRLRTVLNKEKASGNLRKHELIFVNDASEDRSLEILSELSKGHHDICILNMSRRFGVTPCVVAGFRHASGDLVIYMDADLQDPPEVIPELLSKWRETGADVVHTVRRSRKGEGPFKLFLTSLGYFILNRTTRIRLPIEAGDFKLLTKRAVGYIASLDERKPFMRGMACWIGFRQEFVPYDRAARFAGKTKFHIFSFDVMNNFLESALISFSSAPLRLTSYLGFISILFSLALIIHVAFEKLSGHAIPGWTAIMVAVTFLGSIQLFCIGLIGLYISTIYEEVKKRPTYIIASTHGFSDDEKKLQA